MRFPPPRHLPGLAAGAAILLLLPAAVALAQGQDAEPTRAQIHAAGKLFGSTCATCHLPPDPARATDLAWLRQVTDTA